MIGLWGFLAGCTVQGGPPPETGTKADGFVLEPVARGLDGVTDIQFHGGRMVVSTQKGRLTWVEGGQVKTWLDVPVIAGSERGLLGVAFDPDYATNGRVILSWTEEVGGQTMSRVGIWTTTPGSKPGDAPLTQGPVLFEVVQPWSNHNGGGVQFGPDGMLYIGFGDGGRGGDPLDSGQDRTTALGAMLRLDPDLPAPYVPRDNPFVADPRAVPALWAIGLRNPWRFSFAPDGRLVAADVGQNLWEELSFVARGANLGWNRKEGLVCFDREACPGAFVDPFHVYPRDQGTSITGGYVATAGPLDGRYAFADFGSGRIWSTTLPEGMARASDVREHGKFAANWSTFGRDEAGELYVGDYASGVVYRLSAP